MPGPYVVGNTVRLAATFVASGGAVTDPASVYILTKDPAAAYATYGYPAQVTKAGVGAYYVDVVPSVPGDWYFRVVGTPDKKAADESSFNVLLSNFA